MLKRIVCVGISLCLVLCICGCSSSQNEKISSQATSSQASSAVESVATSQMSSRSSSAASSTVSSQASSAASALSPIPTESRVIKELGDDAYKYIMSLSATGRSWGQGTVFDDKNRPRYSLTAQAAYGKHNACYIILWVTK